MIGKVSRGWLGRIDLTKGSTDGEKTEVVGRYSAVGGRVQLRRQDMDHLPKVRISEARNIMHM